MRLALVQAGSSRSILPTSGAFTGSSEGIDDDGAWMSFSGTVIIFHWSHTTASMPVTPVQLIGSFQLAALCGSTTYSMPETPGRS